MGDHQHYYATDHTEHWSEQLPEHLHQFVEDNWHKIPGQEHEHHQTDTSPVEETEVEELPDKRAKVEIVFAIYLPYYTY